MTGAELLRSLRAEADRITALAAGLRERIDTLTDPTAAEAEIEAVRPLSDNGAVVVVKEPRGAVLTPLAVPMSLAAGRRDSCNGLSAVGDLGCSRAYGAVYAGGVPDR